MTRDPRPALRLFVKTLWASDGRGERRPATRELVLPTGAMHLVFRLSETQLRIFKDLDDTDGRTVATMIVGGARTTPYVRDISQPTRSVGAQLQPGAAQLLLGVPADELSERHTSLEDLWGRPAVEMRERLQETDSLTQQLDLFESFLLGRLPRIRGVHPAVAHAIELFMVTSDVGTAVERSGYSHRRFIALFRQAVGLTPKLYCRILRFQEALRLFSVQPNAAGVNMALDAGYSDQPHLNRDFREFAGLSPGQYRDLAPALTHHVPITLPRVAGRGGQIRPRRDRIRA
jgi:AraC-like DNA-binding protein